jgi:hypothetical protein
VSFQEEKEKMQAQKEEVLSHVNDVLENELQCIICSEYFIEVSRNSGSPFSLPGLSGSCPFQAASAIWKHSEEIFVPGT